MAKIEILQITPNADKLIERIGRVCYDSHDKITETSSDGFIRGLIAKGHHSVLEHAVATIMISKISRSATHQLVRHRLCSFTEMSQRYCTFNEPFGYVAPESCKGIEAYPMIMDTIAKWYTQLIELGIKPEDARMVLPNACHSTIVVTANFRQWRHIIELRTDKTAQWEIRDCCNDILSELYYLYPVIFKDLYKE
jgi:thymidylate synthase (FAD)